MSFHTFTFLILSPIQPQESEQTALWYLTSRVNNSANIHEQRTAWNQMQYEKEPREGNKSA